jgi:hypothetical protein
VAYRVEALLHMHGYRLPTQQLRVLGRQRQTFFK